MKDIIKLFDMSKREKRGDQWLDAITNNMVAGIFKIIIYAIEFVILYLAISYASNRLNVLKLYSHYEYVIQIHFIKYNILNIIVGLIGMFMYVYGRYNLVVISKSNKGKYGQDLFTKGYYAKVRHPLYAMLLTMQLGILSAVCLMCTAIISLIWIGVMYVNLWMEEKRLLEEYEHEYINYMISTKRRLFNNWQLIVVATILLFNLWGLSVN